MFQSNLIRNFAILLMPLCCFVVPQASPAATIYAIDVNTSDSPTAPGFEGILGRADTPTVVNGVTFTLLPSVRFDVFDRGQSDPLTTDFVAGPVGSTGSVILSISGLSLGDYDVESWHYDPASVITGDVYIFSRRGDTGGFVGIGSHMISSSPARYQISSDGASLTQFAFRGTGGSSAPMFNGIRLRLIPEPASLAMLAAAGLAMLRRRRR